MSDSKEFAIFEAFPGWNLKNCFFAFWHSGLQTEKCCRAFTLVDAQSK
jgi:hypothetical protein